MKVMPTKRPKLAPGTPAITTLGGLFMVLLLFMAGCHSQEAVQITPTETSPKLKPATMTPPIKKTNPPRDNPPLPTLEEKSPTTPTPLPATATGEPIPITIRHEDTPGRLALDSVEATAVAMSLVHCDKRLPGADLHAIVTLDYGLNPEFVPGDLVALAGHLPQNVTLGYPTEIREEVLQPLVDLINDMIAAGLHPRVLSGYRSYTAQAISWNKWNTLYPERASIISAPPGHSEHQLGTVIDFGSPELPGIVGQPGIQFHTYFYKTSEGQWLAKNAHKYGFTLSYPREAIETTGFYYEPWHYRYVGQSMAGQLHKQEISLTELQLASQPPPCRP